MIIWWSCIMSHVKWLLMKVWFFSRGEVPWSSTIPWNPWKVDTRFSRWPTWMGTFTSLKSIRERTRNKILKTPQITLVWGARWFTKWQKILQKISRSLCRQGALQNDKKSCRKYHEVYVDKVLYKMTKNIAENITKFMLTRCFTK